MLLNMPKKKEFPMKIQLTQDIAMPTVGFGTYLMDDKQAEVSVTHALKADISDCSRDSACVAPMILELSKHRAVGT